MALTIKQIAQLAGVSRGTVDRVIHGRPGVSPEVKASVQRLLDELEYAPNVAAVALKGVSRNISIGAIIPDLHNEFFYEVYDGIREAAKRFKGYGITLIEYKMEESTEEALLAGVETLLDKQVDGLIMQAINGPDIRNRLSQLRPDYPIVTFNSDFVDCRRMCFVGQDALAAGRVAGQMMVMQLRNAGKLAIIIGQAALAHQKEREAGFRQVLQEKAPQQILIGPFETKENETLAYSITRELLSREPELVGIYATGGGQKSVAAALNDSGRADSVILVGHDLLPKTIEYLRQGVVNCTIAQEPFYQGYMPVEILSEYLLFGVRPAKEFLYTSIDIRIQDNAMFNGFRTFRES